jgi:hypothetical protein
LHRHKIFLCLSVGVQPPSESTWSTHKTFTWDVLKVPLIDNQQDKQVSWLTSQTDIPKRPARRQQRGALLPAAQSSSPHSRRTLSTGDSESTKRSRCNRSSSLRLAASGHSAARSATTAASPARPQTETVAPCRDPHCPGFGVSGQSHQAVVDHAASLRASQGWRLPRAYQTPQTKFSDQN